MNSKEIYDDLPQFDIASDIEKVRNENEILHQRIVQLEEEVSNLSKTIVNLKKIQQNLATNISELYKTALCEINRKNQIISDLRTQLDDLIFKRQNNNNYNTDRKIKFYDKRSRSPSIDNRSTKKFKIENNSKDCDRYRYKISPRKLIIRRKVEKIRHKHSDRESSKDSYKQRTKHEDREQDRSKTSQNRKEIDTFKNKLEDRQLDDDNFLKTANSKGNIYKKDLFQDQNLSVNNNNTKRSEKRKIDVVTKKLFDKAEHGADKAKQTDKSEDKSKNKKNIEDEKEFKVDKLRNKEKSKDQMVETESNVKNEIKIVRQVFNEAILNNKTMLQLSDDGRYKIDTDKTLENTKINGKSDKIAPVKEKIKHKKDRKIDKKSDRKSVDKSRRSTDNGAKTKIIDELVKNRKEKIFDSKLEEKKTPIENSKESLERLDEAETKIDEIVTDKEEKIFDCKPEENLTLDLVANNEQIDTIPKESRIETEKSEVIVNKSPITKEISDKIVANEAEIDEISQETVVENQENDRKIDEINRISLKGNKIEKSLEDKINEMFNSPPRTDPKSTENLTIPREITNSPTNLNEINDYNIKECVVQLKSNDIVDEKMNEFKTPIKDTITNPSGRILRSAKKKILECIEEIKPPVSVKTTKPKRGRPRKNSTIQQTNIEIINDDNIPVLHIIESPNELNNVELTPPIVDSIVKTPKLIENSSLSNNLSSSTDSDVSNRSRVRKRRRCIIKMID